MPRQRRCHGTAVAGAAGAESGTRCRCRRCVRHVPPATGAGSRTTSDGNAYAHEPAISTGASVDHALKALMDEARSGAATCADQQIGCLAMSWLGNSELRQNGSARGYQGIFVPLAALSSPGFGPMDGQPSRIFIHRRA